MSKISGYTYNTSMTTSDFLLGDSASGPTTQKFQISNLINTKLLTNPYKFSVYRNAAYTTSGSWAGAAAVIFDTKLYDTSTNFSTVTGLFTAPIAGFYQFNAYGSAALTAGVGYGINLIKNGSAFGFGTGGVSGNATFTNSAATSDLIQLSANDTVGVNFYASANAGATGANANRFSGFLVSAL